MHPVYEKLKLVLGLQSISILVPRIWFHVPHPSNGQTMPKTKPFRRQKRRFLDGARLQEFWLRRAGPPYRPQSNGGAQLLYVYIYIGFLFLDGFGDADSFNKMGSYLQILSELVSTGGAMANRTCRRSLHVR